MEIKNTRFISPHYTVIKLNSIFTGVTNTLAGIVPAQAENNSVE